MTVRWTRGVLCSRLIQPLPFGVPWAGRMRRSEVGSERMTGPSEFAQASFVDTKSRLEAASVSYDRPYAEQTMRPMRCNQRCNIVVVRRVCPCCVLCVDRISSLSHARLDADGRAGDTFVPSTNRILSCRALPAPDRKGGFGCRGEGGPGGSYHGRDRPRGELLVLCGTLAAS